MDANTLERCWILPTPDSSRAVHVIRIATGIAVPTTVCHALAALRGVDVLSIASGCGSRGRARGEGVARHRRGSEGVGGRAGRVRG